MKYVIDTSAYSAFNRGDTRFRPVLSTENELLVPLIVLSELRAGFACGAQAQRNEQLLQRLLNQMYLPCHLPKQPASSTRKCTAGVRATTAKAQANVPGQAVLAAVNL